MICGWFGLPFGHHVWWFSKCLHHFFEHRVCMSLWIVWGWILGTPNLEHHWKSIDFISNKWETACFVFIVLIVIFDVVFTYLLVCAFSHQFPHFPGIDFSTIFWMRFPGFFTKNGALMMKTQLQVCSFSPFLVPTGAPEAARSIPDLIFIDFQWILQSFHGLWLHF